MAETDSALYAISIEGDGLAFSKQVDSATLGRVMYALLSGSDAPSMADVSGSACSDGDSVEQPERMSLREYLTSAGASRYSEKITCIGGYLQSHELRDSFSKDDIKNRFRNAGEPAPANFHRDFSNAVAAGWVAEDVAQSGKYYVTHTGEAAIAAGFSGSGRPTPVRHYRRKRSSYRFRAVGE
jgi:hypothetical protein